MSPIISAHRLSKKYGTKTVLNEVNFEIQAGRIVGLIGPNGSGMSNSVQYFPD